MQKKGTGFLLATTKAMGYEAQTTATKDTKQEEKKEVLVMKTRRRQSSYSEIKLKHSITTVNSQGTVMTKRGTRSLSEAKVKKTSARMT
jgi:hypothetical protein